MGKKKRSRNAPAATRTEVPAIRKPAARQRRTETGLLAILVAACVLAAGVGAYLWWRNAAPPAPMSVASNATQSTSPHFVGAKVCGDCHSGEYAAWQSSQHAKAMQHATDATVLGDFNNARFEYNGIVSTFFRRDGKFFATTDGKDGQLADFEILYTFGLYPLQQYLVAFPDGRVQPLPIAWDARPKDEGGGRWYHLYPNEHITNKDPLH